MSFQSELSSVSYDGNESNTTPYVVGFPFFDESDLVVVVTDEDGMDEVLVLNSDYSVTGAGEPEGGEILTMIGVPANSTVTIYREVKPVQNTSYEEADAFPAKSHERGLDRLTMLCQQVIRAVKRSYRIRESDGDMDEVAAVANTILGLSATKQPRTFTASELASFLNLTQQYFDRPIKTFADAGERNLGVPEFVGQLATQRDEGSIWISSGVTAGAWTLFDIAPPAGSLSTAQLSDGILSADTTGRAKMADAFITLGKVGAGIFTADPAGRAKFASGFVNSSLLASGVVPDNLPAGAVLKTVVAKNSSFSTVTANIPNDNTIPQLSEGTQILSASITPTSTSSKILIRVNFFGTTAGSAVYTIAAFRDAVSDAIGAVANFGQGYTYNSCLDVLDSPASTSALSYSVRVGSNTGNLYVNGATGGAQLFDGRGGCMLIVQEIKG